MAEDYAFIGLGAMGYAMASNIRKKMPSTSTLYINDINASACTRFQSKHSHHGHISIVSSAREAASNASILISIIPDSPDVEAVYLDPSHGVIAAPKDSTRILLECSTISVSVTKAIGAALSAAERGIYIDAPVSGGVPAAESGSLSLLIGHRAPSPTTPSALSQRLTAVLSMLGPPEKSFYLDKLGAGLTAKISNNYLSGTILLATAEAMAIGVAHGLDPAALYSVIKNSTGQSWMADHVCPIPNVQTEYWVPSNSGYKPGFRTQMMLKDLGLGVQSAREVGVGCSMAERALAVWKEAAGDERCRDRDGSSVYLHVGGVLPEGYEDKGRRGEDGEWVFGEWWRLGTGDDGLT